MLRSRLFFGLTLFFIVVLIALIFLSFFAKIEIYANAKGKVVTEDNLIKIQHFEGGVVSEISVAEGESIKKGDELLKIELPRFRESKDEIVAKIEALEITKKRLLAEIGGYDFDIEIVDSEKRESIKRAELDLFLSNKEELKNSISIADDRIKRKRSEIENIEIKLDFERKREEIVDKKLEIEKELLESGLSSKKELLEIEDEKNSLNSNIKNLKNLIIKENLALDEIIKERDMVQISYKNRARSMLVEVEKSIQEAKERVDNLNNTEYRSTIYSPTDGIVKNLLYKNLGSVVKSGESILEIVPQGDRYLFEVYLRPSDRGFVRLNQEVYIKVDSYNYIMYGKLKGVISNIGGDTVKSDNQEYGYRVFIESNSTIEARGEKLPLYPGMNIEVDIKIGERSFFEYLIVPLEESIDRSFSYR